MLNSRRCHRPHHLDILDNVENMTISKLSDTFDARTKFQVIDKTTGKVVLSASEVSDGHPCYDCLLKRIPEYSPFTVVFSRNQKMYPMVSATTAGCSSPSTDERGKKSAREDKQDDLKPGTARKASTADQKPSAQCDNTYKPTSGLNEEAKAASARKELVLQKNGVTTEKMQFPSTENFVVIKVSVQCTRVFVTSRLLRNATSPPHPVTPPLLGRLPRFPGEQALEIVAARVHALLLRLLPQYDHHRIAPWLVYDAQCTL